MTRLAWMTDTHLDFLSPAAVEAFLANMAQLPVDGYLLGGDMAHGGSLAEVLEQMHRILAKPVYFVLGNHDFYGSSLAGITELVGLYTSRFPNLCYLPAAGVVSLSATTGLVGHGGWGDGGYGQVTTSPKLLNDWRHIREFQGLTRSQREALLARLGQEGAAHLQQVLPQALANHEHVLVLTHVPPFRDVSIYQSQEDRDNSLPHFACRAIGDLLRAVMTAHPGRCMTVLAGHTHRAEALHVLPNLRVITAGAAYGFPQAWAVLEVDQVFSRGILTPAGCSDAAFPSASGG